MGFGFFGKVPQKGDYLAVNLPPTVLLPLENWMSQALAASKIALGEHWQPAYLVAPIWRFWLPRHVLGASCAGALVSSVDSGGRYFPAALLFVAGDEGDIDNPANWDVDTWMAQLDQRLFEMLRSNDEEYLGGLTKALPQPARANQETNAKSLWWHGRFGADNSIRFGGLPPVAAYALMITAVVAAT